MMMYNKYNTGAAQTGCFQLCYINIVYTILRETFNLAIYFLKNISILTIMPTNYKTIKINKKTDVFLIDRHVFCYSSSFNV